MEKKSKLLGATIPVPKAGYTVGDKRVIEDGHGQAYGSGLLFRGEDVPDLSLCDPEAAGTLLQVAITLLEDTSA